MINMLKQKIGIVLNPLIHNTNHNYQQLAPKMGRIADFLGAPQMLVQQFPNNQIL